MMAMAKYSSKLNDRPSAAGLEGGNVHRPSRKSLTEIIFGPNGGRTPRETGRLTVCLNITMRNAVTQAREEFCNQEGESQTFGAVVTKEEKTE
jgi:hypothetical protein